ncbi:hypothetical protein ACFVUB_18105 [Streptomyces niveus]|uniref:hypothetical protein n=1 Tax=Streptomyces niveus TaxID=193462 RepID=UPI0036DD8DF4
MLMNTGQRMAALGTILMATGAIAAVISGPLWLAAVPVTSPPERSSLSEHKSLIGR